MILFNNKNLKIEKIMKKNSQLTDIFQDESLQKRIDEILEVKLAPFIERKTEALFHSRLRYIAKENPELLVSYIACFNQNSNTSPTNLITGQENNLFLTPNNASFFEGFENQEFFGNVIIKNAILTDKKLARLKKLHGSLIVENSSVISFPTLQEIDGDVLLKNTLYLSLDFTRQIGGSVFLDNSQLFLPELYQVKKQIFIDNNSKFIAPVAKYNQIRKPVNFFEEKNRILTPEAFASKEDNNLEL